MPRIRLLDGFKYQTARISFKISIVTRDHAAILSFADTKLVFERGNLYDGRKNRGWLNAPSGL